MSIHSWLWVNPNSHQDEVVPTAQFEDVFLSLIVATKSTSTSSTVFTYSQIFVINKFLTLDKALASSLLINETNFLAATHPHQVSKQAVSAVWTRPSISCLRRQCEWVCQSDHTECTETMGWDKTRKYFFHWHMKSLAFNWPRNPIIFKALLNFVCKGPIHYFFSHCRKGSKLLTSNTISIVFTVAGLRIYLTISRKKKKPTKLL